MNNNYPSLLSPFYRKKILLFLENYILKKEQEYSGINKWGPDVCRRLLEFIPLGKLIRGSLVVFANEALGGAFSKDIIYSASAVELFHSALLIHDDSMDNDQLRRGRPSIYYQYQLKGDRENVSDSQHYGKSLSICVGDFVFFMGYNLLSKITDGEISKKVNNIFSNELEVVSLSQMEDVHQAYTSYEPDENEIENQRVLKSGRYTISLPLMVGGAMAQVKESTLMTLKAIGAKTGLVFQLRDDELGIFGEEKKTGKPEGTDVRENKKTLHRYLLYKNCQMQDKKKIDKIFGNAKMTGDDLEHVRELMVKLGVKEEIKDRIDKLQIHIADELIKLKLKNKHEMQFMEFVKFLATREK